MLWVLLAAAVVPPVHRAIVRAVVRRLFAQVSQGNWQAINATMAGDFFYRFYGSHTLSGVRRRQESLAAWWERVFRLLPDASFEIQRIVVDGPPWKTRVATHMVIRGTLPNGTPYANVFMQQLTLRLNRVLSVETLEDTDHLVRAMQALAADGFEEAVAPEIADEPAPAY